MSGWWVVAGIAGGVLVGGIAVHVVIVLALGRAIRR